MSRAAASPFIDALSHHDVNMLKAIARRWIGRDAYKLRKNELLAALPAAIRDPARLKEVAAGLSPQERAVLGLLKRAGGSTSKDALAVAVRFAQVDLPGDQGGYRDPLDNLLLRMTNSGLITGISRYSYGHDAATITAEPRLLAFVEPPPPRPLQVATLPPQAEEGLTLSPARRPNAITLDLIAVVEGVAAQGGLARTQSGELRVNDLRRLGKALGWDRRVPDGLTELREPLSFFLGLLAAAGLLVEEAGVLRGADDAEAALQLHEQALFARLLSAYLALSGWTEEPALSYRPVAGAAGRRLLIEGLRCLPEGGLGAVDSAAFSQALFEQTGDHASHGRGYLAPFRATPAEAAADREKWRRQQERFWAERQRPWLEVALRGPMTALGLVQTGQAEDRGVPLAFRLTDLGRAVLLAGPGARPRRARAPAAQGAWVIQPTFEVIVYLEHATAAQLTFIERHAERRSSSEHTALYQLTAEALYGALERGSRLQDVLGEMERGASVPLPQNVRAELTSWAAQCQRITVHPAAHLLEFPSAAARDAALKQGLDGRPVGEVFALIGPDLTAAKAVTRSINYATAPARCLRVSEDGALVLQQGKGDLLVSWQAERYAEPRQEGRWQLTQASVRKAMAAGASREGIVAWLTARATNPVPPVLLLAIQGWTGALPPFALGELAVLRCPDEATCQALRRSATLAPYLRGVLGPTLLLIDPAALDTVRAVLGQLGVSATDQFV